MAGNPSGAASKDSKKAPENEHADLLRRLNAVRSDGADKVLANVFGNGMTSQDVRDIATEARAPSHGEARIINEKLRKFEL